MSDPALVVPVQLDALVVNQGVLGRDSFRWWQFNYKSLSHFKSPEPMALDRSVGTPQQGVYLHWTLPDALRHGVGAAGDGSVYPLAPNRWLVLRVSGAGPRQATAWVVESDCPSTPKVDPANSAQASMYLVDPGLVQLWNASGDPVRTSTGLDPNSTKIQVGLIGIRFPLAGWSERAAETMFLTAVAPSNPLFSIYTPHNGGVFSLFDDLSGIDNDTLSYFVYGWYSDPTKDIVASWPSDQESQDPYAALLDRLGWTVAGPSDFQACASVYQGMVCSVAWNRQGNPPDGDPLQQVRDSGQLNVAVGNTTIDAFTTLIGKQLNDPRKTELLRAFQYDFLQQLNQINGEALLDEKIRQAWFASKAGGYAWTIVANNSDGSTGAPLTVDEASWLHELNTNQASLDAALTTLYSLQWELHSLWLKSGYLSDPANTFPTPPQGIVSGSTTLGSFQSQLTGQLDPGQSGSVASRLVAQFAEVQKWLALVPQPADDPHLTAQEALQQGIRTFSQSKGLDLQKTLKAMAAPRYWQANNPVVVLSGVEPAPSAVAAANLPVRLSSHLVTGFTVGSTTIDGAGVAGIIPAIANAEAISAPALLPLFQEFFLLDAANAAQIASATDQSVSDVSTAMVTHPGTYQGTLPAVGLEPWAQPWNPMFMEWTGIYTHIPFNTGETKWWSFDGTDYHYTPGTGAPPTDSRQVSGISLLSPHASFVFGSQLDKFVSTYGTATELAQIDQWVEKTYNWQFLAQELTGLQPSLALRDPRAFRRPAATDLAGSLPLAALTGYGDGVVPPSLELPDSSLGQVNSVPFFPNGPALTFHGTRQGELYFRDIWLYDKFGRVLYAIASTGQSGLFDYTNFPLLVDDALRGANRLPSGVASTMQLPPRLLQNARLDFRLLDGHDDTKVYGSDAGAVPISGWVLPNHLDNSLLVYAPDGAALGEFRLLVGADGTKTAQWQPPPHKDLTMADVLAAAPHLQAMLTSPQIQQESGFTAFLAAIDETLWTTDPFGSRVDQNLSVLVGRPLALLRARLQFQLEGDPVNDTSWAATFNQTSPEFLNIPFSIRLGDQATRTDGLIGYFAETDYSVFNSVANPQEVSGQNYVQPIGPLGQSGGSNYLQLGFAPDTFLYATLLADPRGAVHATTGILPVKQLDIPQQFVDAALANLEISFRMGPLLTRLVPSPSQGDQTPVFPVSVTYPLPVEQNGAWSWWEPPASTGGWTGYGLVDASPAAQMGAAPDSLREGYFQFVTRLPDSQGGNSPAADDGASS